MAKSSLTRFQNWISEWDDSKTRQLLMVVLVVLSGLLAGMLVYTIAKYVLDQLFPFPPGLYMVDAEQKAELMKTVASQVFIIIPVTWAVGALIGGYLATAMGKVGQFPAWLTGILLTAYFWIDLLHLPYTTTLFILCPVIVGLCAIASGWLGMYLTAQKAMKSQQAEV
jgi:MFS family permease